MTDLAAANRAINELYERVGERITRLRITQGLTQSDLAKQIGLQRSSVANIEVGRQRTPLHVLVAAAQALGVTLPELLGDQPLPDLAVPVPRGLHLAAPAVIRARGSLRELLSDLDKLKLALDEIDVDAEAAA